MAEVVTVGERPRVEERILKGRRLILTASLIGVLGIIVFIIGLIVDARHAFLAYLTAWTYAVSIAVGALVFIAIGHAMNASWVAVVRRLAHAVAGSLPLLFLGLVPVLLGAAHIYPWIEPYPPLSEHQLHQLHHKEPYLNLPMFALRSVLYFVIWNVAAWLLRSWSLRRDAFVRDGRVYVEEAPGHRERVLSSASLPFIGLAITFAAFDWVMSLQPLWFSTIFGLYLFAGGFLAALAVITILAWASVRSNLLTPELRGPHFHAMGRLLLGFTAFWAYCGYFQAMLIRIADIPHEVTFFLRRLEGGWEFVAYTLIIGHFAIPFAVLLLRSWKLIPAAMAGVSAWILLMGYVDVYWLIMPVLDGHGPFPDWIDIAALCAVFGSLVGFSAWRQSGHSLLAEGDPSLEAGLAYESKY